MQKVDAYRSTKVVKDIPVGIVRQAYEEPRGLVCKFLNADFGILRSPCEGLFY
jgi:hypothetical protein